MNNYKYESLYKISPFEKDINNSIKIGALLNYMQLTAANSLNNIDKKFSIEGLAQKGLGWFLIRYRLEIQDYPTNIDEILIKTECRGCHKMTTFRDFKIINSKTEQILLKATSSWFVVDLNSKSLINISKEFPDFRTFEKCDDDIVLGKLKAIDNYDCEKEFQVLYDNLDMNGHVNNTVYATWALEALDYEFRTLHKLKTLDIFFKHEVKYNDKILSKVKIDLQNLISHHLIINSQTGEEVCLINAEFETI